MEHLGSTHTEVELELLKAAARQKLAAGKGELDPGLSGPAPGQGGPLLITSSRMGHLWDALEHAYRVLGSEAVAGDPVFRDLVLTRIIEPTSKLDSARVLGEVGVAVPAYLMVTRPLPVFAREDFGRKLASACPRQTRLGPASLVLYAVSTLYFEADQGEGFRESGFSKECRLEPQITIGLLTDHTGLPLMVEAFEGNKAEMLTMIPTIRAFMAAHGLADVTIVAEVGMVCEANKKVIEAAGLSFTIGARIPQEPYVITAWRKRHPGQEIPDGYVFTQPWPAGPTDGRRDHTFYYQYRHDRAGRIL